MQINEKVPNFTLKTATGESVSLESFAGKYVVLFFYPKDLTPGCTIEACEFRDAYQALQDEGAELLGIGKGDAKSKEKFTEKHNLNFPLLIDEDLAFSTEVGIAREKSMFGKKYMGIARTTWLIGPDGNLLHEWEKVNPLGHAKKVLEKLKEFKSAS